MNIVQLNTTYGDADSTGRNVKELHNCFKENGHSSYVFVNKITDLDRNLPDCVQLFSNDVDEKIHAFLSRLTGLQGYYSTASTRRLISQISALNPDAVVLNVLHSNCINFNLLFDYLSKNNIATIFVLHDCFFFTGHCCHYTDVHCDRWMKECGHCPSKRKWNKSLFFDRSKKSLQDKKKWYALISKIGVICVSEWMKRQAELSILKETNITTIYNWVDLSVFKYTGVLPKIIPQNKGKYIGVCVASYWDNDKGADAILELSYQLPEMTIIVIGRAEGLFNDRSNIFKAGVIKDTAEMAKYYSMADVFLNPSMQETFGKTTAEAIACGTPVVAYETTACTELVDVSRGELAHLGNKQDYINKVKKVLNNGKDSYRVNTRIFAEENFDGNKNMKKYIDFIRKLAERP